MWLGGAFLFVALATAACALVVATVLTYSPVTAASDKIVTPADQSVRIPGQTYLVYGTGLRCPYTTCVPERLRVTGPTGREVHVGSSGFQGIGLESRKTELGTQAAVFTAEDDGSYTLQIDEAVGTLQLGVYPQMNWRYFWLFGLTAVLIGTLLMTIGMTSGAPQSRSGPEPASAGITAPELGSERRWAR